MSFLELAPARSAALLRRGPAAVSPPGAAPRPDRTARRRLPVLIAGLVLAAGVPAPGGAGAQTPGDIGAPPPTGDVARPIPADTYADANVEALLTRARIARTVIAEGLHSYEGRMWEHTYFGVSGANTRRERGLMDEERVARIRWTREGDHVVRWEGARRDSPILGRSSAEDETMANRLARNLSGEGDVIGRTVVPPPLAFDPGSDRIAFGADWALNPLADTAGYHYRFESGDTLRITLPGTDQRIVLAEVRVEPRRTEFRLVSASLWFDAESGTLVRAGYRPGRPFDLELDGSPGGDRPPGLFLPIRAEIRYVTVDHGLHDLQWWIPRRFSFQGEARVAELARFPVTVEWTVDEVRVNEETDLIPDLLPPGWTMREVTLERDEGDVSLTVLVPPAGTLAGSPELRSDAPSASAAAFSPAELRELERRLQTLAPRLGPPGITLAWGLQERLTRYNRVEGLSPGVGASMFLPRRLDLRGELRYGVADGEVGGELRLRRGPEGRSQEIAVFRRLDSSSEWARPHTTAASVGTLLWGRERTPFHRAWGAEAIFRREERPVGGELRLFVERQDSAVRETHAHLRRLWSDHALEENPSATAGTWTGSSASLRWQAGMDPRGGRAFGHLQLEGGTGASSYGRGWTSAGVTFPVGSRLTGALEAGAGVTAGELPLQRRFFPGGAMAFRGVLPGELVGEAFWFARGEIGRSLPAAKLVAFSDLIQVGPRRGFGSADREVALGVGASFLDGLVRLDVARNTTRQSWNVIFYMDGLF